MGARVFFSKLNLRGQRMVTLSLPVGDVEALLAKACLKISWVSYQMQPNLVVPRCFKCPGFGFVVAKCTGPDHNKNC